MSAGPLWSVKGVDDETREIARRAAEASGMTIGNWIDSAILRRTSPAETPASPPIEMAREPSSAPPAAPVAPEARVNGVHPGETVPVSRPPPRFVRLVDEPLPPLEPVQPFNEFEFGRPPIYRRLRTPRAMILVAGAAAGIAVAIAVLVLEGELFGRSDPGPKVGGDTPAATAEAAAPNQAASETSPAGEGAAIVARLRADAERGNAFAENDLGLLYATGRYVPADDREAFTWFERAAAKGLVSAKFNMGAMYQRGRGVALDPQLAAQWYQRAADEGHIMAQHNLASMYSRGEGVTQDHAKAARLYAQAAEAGFAASQFRLGQLHEEGLGVKKDKKAALGWYVKAAAQGSGRAQEMVRKLQAETVAVAAPVRTSSGGAKPNAATRETVRETQQLLARLDFAPGAADGRLGPQTERAIRDFQRAAGLRVTGAASPELLEELKAVAATMAADREPSPSPR